MQKTHKLITWGGIAPTLVLGLAGAAGAWAQGGFNGPGGYEITNLKSGKVLDLDRNDQSTVIQFSSRGTDNQTWYFERASNGYYFIRNGMNGYALDAVGNGNSSPLRGTPFNGGQSQMWRIDNGKDGNALIVNSNGKSIDIPDGSNRDGLRIQIYDLNGDSNQRFILRRVSGRPNWGNNYGGNQNRITCASDSGSRVYCAADTRGGVQMVRQISGSSCTQGYSWGYDQRGIWVDRGCRAEFVTGGAGNNWNNRGYRDRDGDRDRDRDRDGYNRGPVRLTCSSDDGGRNYCSANTSGGVRMVRQISGSPCTQGRTWGFDRQGIWVDRGCRAEFEVTQ